MDNHKNIYEITADERDKYQYIFGSGPDIDVTNPGKMKGSMIPESINPTIIDTAARIYGLVLFSKSTSRFESLWKFIVSDTFYSL